MGDYTPVFTGGAIPKTMQVVTGAVTGGTFVSNAGVGLVATSGAGSATVVGVAAHDAAVGAKVTVWPLRNVTHEVPVVAAGTVTAGDGVITGALGTAATAAVATAAAAGTLIGIAESTATAPNLVRFIGRG